MYWCPQATPAPAQVKDAGYGMAHTVTAGAVTTLGLALPPRLALVPALALLLAPALLLALALRLALALTLTPTPHCETGRARYLASGLPQSSN